MSFASEIAISFGFSDLTVGSVYFLASFFDKCYQGGGVTIYSVQPPPKLA